MTMAFRPQMLILLASSLPLSMLLFRSSHTALLPDHEYTKPASLRSPLQSLAWLVSLFHLGLLSNLNF